MQIRHSNFKAALISIFISTMGQMIMCNVKGVAYSNNPTENYHPILQCSLLSSTPVPAALVSCFQKKCSHKLTLPGKHQTADKDGDWVNTARHLAAKESDIFLRS